MPQTHDAAISEITAFILIIAVIAASVGIYVAVVIPVKDANDIVAHEDEILKSFMTLKSDIDRLWLMGDAGEKTVLILPASQQASCKSVPTTAGTLFKTTPTFSFNHSGVSKTASLLRISYTEPKEQAYLNQRDIIFEGGAVFSSDHIYLAPTTGKSKAILICTNDLDEAISTNTHTSIVITYIDTKIYTNVTDLRFKDETNIGYETNIRYKTNTGYKTKIEDEINIADIDTLILVEVSVDMEAVR